MTIDDDIASALAHLGEYRVLRVQQLCRAHDWLIPASVMLSLGYHETGLQNINGGAVLKNGAWVPSKSDRGWLQISDLYPENRQFLGSKPGCQEGLWVITAGKTALDEGYCPRFSDATNFTLTQMLNDYEYGIEMGVKHEDLLRFAVAAHNAGPGGALAGYRAGDLDKYTAHDNYSAQVMALAPAIHSWVVDHSNWVWTA